jgi:hypothetical protein
LLFADELAFERDGFVGAVVDVVPVRAAILRVTVGKAGISGSAWLGAISGIGGGARA